MTRLKKIVAAMEAMQDSKPHEHFYNVCPKCAGTLTCKCMGKTPENTKQTNDVCSYCANRKVSMESVTVEHAHYHNTCPECDCVSQCRCESDEKVHTNNICYKCEFAKVATESTNATVVETNPNSVVDPKTLLTDPVVNNTSQEEVIRNQMEEEGFNVDDAGEMFVKDLKEIGTDVLSVAAIDQQVDQLTKATEALESVYDSLASANVVTESAVMMANTSLSIICDNVGMKKKPSLSLESFQSSRAVALEDIQDTAKRIWQKIVEFIKKAIEVVGEFFSKIFGTTAGLKKQAANLRAKIRDAKVSPPESTRIHKAGLSQALMIDGKVPTEFKPHLMAFEDTVKSVLNAGLNTSDKMIKLFESMFSRMDEGMYLDIVQLIHLPKDDIDSSKIIPFDSGNVPPGMVRHDIVQRFYLTKALLICRSDELFGNKAVYGTVRNKDMVRNEALLALGASSSGIYPFNAELKSSESDHLPVLSQREMSEIVDTVESVLEIIAQYKTQSEQTKNVKKRMLFIANNLYKLDFHEDNWNIPGDTRALVTGGIRMMDHPAMDVCSYAARTCHHLMEYVNESLKHYSDVKESKAKPTTYNGHKPELIPA